MPEKKNKRKRSGVWVEAKTFHEPHSGLAVVVKERIRGAHSYSLQVIHLDKAGQGNTFLPALQRPIEELKADDKDVYMEDVVFSLFAAARQWISQQKKKENPKGDRKPKKDKPRGPKKERKSEGGLSALARKDAQAKGHDYKSPSERKKEKRQQAKEQTSS